MLPGLLAKFGLLRKAWFLHCKSVSRETLIKEKLPRLHVYV